MTYTALPPSAKSLQAQTPLPTISINDAPEVLYRVRATYRFEAVKDDDLALGVGDGGDVEREDGEWLFGRDVGGRAGWFPRTFVERVDGGFLVVLFARIRCFIE